MLTTRIYRAARPANEVVDELRRGSGSQFCPRCVSALERLLQGEHPEEPAARPYLLATAS
jgi:HD-GYP domain-containing protein (c-di-GMP phosphodiesterase class II)